MCVHALACVCVCVFVCVRLCVCACVCVANTPVKAKHLFALAFYKKLDHFIGNLIFSRFTQTTKLFYNKSNEEKDAKKLILGDNLFKVAFLETFFSAWENKHRTAKRVDHIHHIKYDGQK